MPYGGDDIQLFSSVVRSDVSVQQRIKTARIIADRHGFFAAENAHHTVTLSCPPQIQVKGAALRLAGVHHPFAPRERLCAVALKRSNLLG